MENRRKERNHGNGMKTLCAAPCKQLVSIGCAGDKQLSPCCWTGVEDETGDALKLGTRRERVVVWRENELELNTSEGEGMWVVVNGKWRMWCVRWMNG
ncbi:hypothetical protein TanjilG_00551 [Lupinus angustifolius]|uniref:Uncharacterized protein n=1 Tax=Lupinus angustifolius TaxID=3871 RepID=A0A394D9B8_LUPAN|nr:hypothetical protein TanjilG_00551 [Lupinus angustifolius]